MMRRYKHVLCFFAVMVVALAYMLAYGSALSTGERMVFKERVRGMELRPWHDETTGKSYLFLPSYATEADIEGHVPEGIEVVRLAGVPSLFVDLQEGGLEYANEDKLREQDVSVISVDTMGEITTACTAKLRGRGNSTWASEKKPYNLTFAKPMPLAGSTDVARRWNLLANAYDGSKVRNAVVYGLARRIGIEHTCDVGFANFFVNGAYRGLYNLSTKYTYETDTTGIARAVFEFTRSATKFHYVSSHGQYVRFRHGDGYDVIRAVESAEHVLHNEEATFAQVSERIDIPSFARMFLLDIVTMNKDISQSHYYAVDARGKVYAIDAWDRDLSFGSTSMHMEFAPNQMIMEDEWSNSLVRHEAFRGETLRLLEEYESDVNTAVGESLDSIYSLIAHDWEADTLRWHGPRSMMDVSEVYSLTTIDECKAYIRQQTATRLTFLRQWLANPEAFRAVVFYEPWFDGWEKRGWHLYFRDGDTLRRDNLPGGMLNLPYDGFHGWATKDSIDISSEPTVQGDMAFFIQIEAGLAPDRVGMSLLRKVWFRVSSMGFLPYLASAFVVMWALLISNVFTNRIRP